MRQIQRRLAGAFLALTTLTASLSAGEAKDQNTVWTKAGADDGLRQAFERAIYSLKDSGDGTFRGNNQKQRLHVELDQRAIRLQHAQGDASFRLSGYGYGAQLRTPKEAQPVGTSYGVEYRRGELTEWYKNETSGLEQGFTLERRPGTVRQGEPLVITLAIEGDLRPALAPTGDAVLLESRGQTILRYGGLRSWDARGRAIASRLEVREREIRLVIEDQDAQYPLTVDPTWTQQAELTASDGATSDNFGWSVSVDGGTAVIGAYQHQVGTNAGQGAAYVFVQSGTTWTQQAELTASDGAAGDNFGRSVSVSGGTAVIGAPNHEVGTNTIQGAAYVFVQSGTTWTQQAELTASDGAAGDNFGFSVSVSGDTAVIGAPAHEVGTNTDQGVAYVFVRSGTTWSQQDELTASDGATDDAFGESVSVSGGTAVIGAPIHEVGTNLQQGAAYVFIQSGTSWSQQAELTASGGAAGDNFGRSVSVSGGTAVIGAPNHEVGSNTIQGAAYVFVQSGTTWSQQAELTGSDGAANDNFGWSVSVSGGTAVIGAPFHEVGTNVGQGAAYVFIQSGTTWSQQAELTASGGAAVGFSVSISGATAVIGAPGTNVAQGAAYVFVTEGPELTASKTDNVGGSTTYPTGWTWTITVTNTGDLDATFNDGDTILTDNLPNSNITYGAVTVTPGSGVTGTINCSIDASDDLSCTASGAVSIDTTTGGSFTVSFSATPSAPGTYANPRASGSCEVPQSGNTCSDTVVVSPAAAAPDLTASKVNNVSGSTFLGSSWTWTITVTNQGLGDATFNNTNTVFTDNLPNSNVSYTATLGPQSGLSGGLQCAFSTSYYDVTCIATSTFTIAPGGYFTIYFVATPSAVGTLANPRAGGICQVDPYNVVTESMSNQTCSDTVVVTAPATAFQVHYVANLDVDDSFINITNDGQSTPVLDPVAAPNGNLCVGVYAFDPNEELQSCCTCLVTPGGLASLSARAINAASLTGENPTSLVIKLLSWSTSAGASSTATPGTPAPPNSSACNAGTPGTVAGGMHAWGTNLHALPVSGYTVTETPFSLATLSPAELANITQSCEFNQINGSGITGQCPGCTVGGQ